LQNVFNWWYFYLAWPLEYLIKKLPVPKKWATVSYINVKSCNAVLDCVWNVMAHAQKPDFVFWQNRQVHLNWRGRQFSRLLAAEVCTSVVVMLDTPCSEVVWRVLATHSIDQFPLHFPSCASSCAITFQLDSTNATDMYSYPWKNQFWDINF